MLFIVVAWLKSQSEISPLKIVAPENIPAVLIT